MWHYRLDLCLTSSRVGTRARFMQHWSADRYEPAGRLFLLPPGEAMQIRSAPGSLKVLVCLATGCAVKAVAYSLGYSSVASFCHAFRKTVGITPGQYKSQIPVRG